MSEKKKFTLYAGSVALCVCTAVLLHYVSVADPYLESACRLLRPFIYIGLYVVWAISFRKRIIQKEIRRCLTAIAAMMIFDSLAIRLVFLLYAYAADPYGQSLSGLLYTAAGGL